MASFISWGADYAGSASAIWSELLGRSKEDGAGCCSRRKTDSWSRSSREVIRDGTSLPVKGFKGPAHGSSPKRG